MLLRRLLANSRRRYARAVKLREIEGPAIRLIHDDTIIGRSSQCGLQLSAIDVSKEHAAMRWTGSTWELRDLNSRNGTFVNGRALRAMERVPIDVGTQIAFGQDELWVCVDATAPMPRATAIDAGEPRVITAPSLLCFGDDEAGAVICRNGQGRWVLEHLGRTDAVHSGDELELGGRTWRLSLPAFDATTAFTDGSRSVLAARLHFFAPPDQPLRLEVNVGGETIALKRRSHHQVLLTLARIRLADLARGLRRHAAGWSEDAALLDVLGCTRNFINVNVFRARKEFEQLGFDDASCIVERMPGTGKLRLGAGRVEIEPT